MHHFIFIGLFELNTVQSNAFLTNQFLIIFVRNQIIFYFWLISQFMFLFVPISSLSPLEPFPPCTFASLRECLLLSWCSGTLFVLCFEEGEFLTNYSMRNNLILKNPIPRNHSSKSRALIVFTIIFVARVSCCTTLNYSRFNNVVSMDTWI